ncbi:MAG: hypothetical protein ACLP3R_10405, partial [Candidatus Korobacteraceae bacterium]
LKFVSLLFVDGMVEFLLGDYLICVQFLRAAAVRLQDLGFGLPVLQVCFEGPHTVSGCIKIGGYLPVI